MNFSERHTQNVLCYCSSERKPLTVRFFQIKEAARKGVENNLLNVSKVTTEWNRKNVTQQNGVAFTSRPPGKENTDLR